MRGQFNGRPLTEQFNELHENVSSALSRVARRTDDAQVKYLPGIKIPDVVVAHPNLLKAVEGANALVFVVPHQVSSRSTRLSQTSS